MPPKVDPSELKIIAFKCCGGEAGPASTLAPKLGPLGLNAKKVGEDIIKETGKFKNIKVMVELHCQNRAATVKVAPTAPALVIKELNEPARTRKKEKIQKHTGNLTLAQIKKIAQEMAPKSLSRTFTGTVKQILGTAMSVGATVDGKHPKEILKKIAAGELNVEK